MSMFIEKDWQSIYMQLGALASDIPANLNSTEPITNETLKWIGKTYALIKQIDNQIDPIQFSSASDNLTGSLREMNSRQIISIIFRNLAIAESNSPATSSGAFIPVGHEFDTYIAIGKIFTEAKENILIVDPYLDEKILTNFAPSAKETIEIKLLFSNINDSKTRIKAAFDAWKKQYGDSRPIDAKIAPQKSLHDRMIIIDNNSVWSLTQSFSAFASRSPATIMKIDGDVANMKISAFMDIWKSSTPISS